MERLARRRSTGGMTTTTASAPAPRTLDAADVVSVIGKRSFCTLGTTSSAGFSHVAGVLYAAVGTDLWISTHAESRKARNVMANPHVAVCVPVRRLPVGPPSSVQWQGTARVVALDDPELVRLHEDGELDAVTSHGELELDGGCFLHVRPRGRLNTYGIGMSLVSFLRDPLAAAGVVDL
ncbi:hypothetical protein B7486_59530 [cyanobacterium TDX16]|nr:hypothetical protein B7486_59530 [cyanobacterium TDX16]